VLKNLFAFSVVVVRAYGASRKASLEVLKKDGAALTPVIKDITEMLKEAKGLFTSSGLKAEIEKVNKDFEEVSGTDPEWAAEGEKAVDGLVEAWEDLAKDISPPDEDEDETEETH
jgi:hypothetical protein